MHPRDPVAHLSERAVLIVSDALGNTAYGVALAALSQFDHACVHIQRLSKIEDVARVQSFLDAGSYGAGALVVLHTVAAPVLRAELAALLAARSIPAIDLLGPAVAALRDLLGREPNGMPGMTHRVDDRYFERIDAMEYFVEHDDGRGADDLSRADIVLLGISRTGKTPLSMYLAFQGYRVANIPLAHGVEPPASIFDIDPAKLFGLISTAPVVSDIRAARIGEEVAHGWSGTYAAPEHVELEMDEARALMRRLGCFIVRTDHRAIEETAAEIVARMHQVAAARDARRAHS